MSLPFSSPPPDKRKSPHALTFPSLRVVLLGAVSLWQIYTIGRLGTYSHHLVESRDRHQELQDALRDAQAALERMQNSTKSCAELAASHANELQAAEQERTSLQYKLEELTELNSMLNQTATAREIALRDEQVKRLTLEGSVQTLKEQMNLMQGQLVTAQQQQGALHGGGGSRRTKHTH